MLKFDGRFVCLRPYLPPQRKRELGPGSHVTIYNNESYGSVYKETMRDYFPQ